MRHPDLSAFAQRFIPRPPDSVGRIAHMARVAGCSALMALAGSAAAPAQFSNISAALTGVHHGSALWGDYDNDNDLDVALTGQTPSLIYFGDIFQNNGGGNFAAISSALPAVGNGNGNNRSAWGDFDNDGDLDLVITGVSSGNPITKIYKNTGGVFSVVTVSPTALIPLSFSSVAWGDYDNDGDLDLFATGYANGVQRVTRIYRNDGASGSNWIFTDATPPGITQVGWSDGAWGDYDNDGDLDLIVSGYTLIGTGVSTTVYRNDGGTLVNSGITNIVNVGQGSVAWGDYNNDGYLDLAVAGLDNTTRYLNIYRNNQDGTFTQTATLGGFSDGSLAWGDCNNDGNLDLLVSGLEISGPGTPATRVYTGNGAGTFTDMNANLTGVYQSQATWGDYDNDGRLDILVAGRLVPNNSVVSKIYRNTINVPANNAPTAPTGLVSAGASPTSITVAWNPATDIETQQAALTYNLSITDQTAGTTVMPPMANTATGYRRIPAIGNTNHNVQWTIGGLTPGHTYAVCVQTIDHQLGTSAFTCGLSVTTPAAGTKPNIMIADCQADVGTEPNNACSNYYTSPSIYVRNQPDGLTPGNDIHQSPLGGVTNWVYVKVKNIGNATLPAGTVHVYYSKASTGLTWPTSWTANYIGGVPYGQYIGQASVTSLAAGASITVPVQWNNVPDPSDYNDPDAHHFCLLARFVSAADPITTAEVASVNTNTVNNNNIAWKNVAIIDIDGPQAPIILGNVHEYAVTAKIRFAVPAAERFDAVLKHCTLTVDLGTELYQKWVSGGSRGTGIRRTGATTVQITANDASLENIQLGGNEWFTPHVVVTYPAFDRTVAGRTYNWEMTQYDAGTGREPDLFIGGETFAIKMPTRPPGKITVPDGSDLGGLIKLAAQPNPTSATTTISYLLPSDSRVKLAVYDLEGNLVRTLVAADQKAGSHATEWNGTTAGGEQVASGTYFYRIETASGIGQGQIKLAR